MPGILQNILFINMLTQLKKKNSHSFNPQMRKQRHKEVRDFSQRHISSRKRDQA